MKITEFNYQNDSFIRQIEAENWGAAQFLAKLLKERRLDEVLGGWAKLFLLTDGDELVSFVTLSAQDYVAEPALTPWLGFFYTAPRYRGHRYGKLLIDHACRIAKKRGCDEVFVATDHIGLYEKYGFCYRENRLDINGEDTRIYCKRPD